MSARRWLSCCAFGLAACGAARGASRGTGDEPRCSSELTTSQGRALQCSGESDAALSRLPPDLESLGLCQTQLLDAAPLMRLHALRALTLFRLARAPTDLAPLAALGGLRALDLTGWSPPTMPPAAVQPFAFVAGLRELRALRLRDTPLADLGVLCGLSDLEELDLTETPVSDLTPLGRLRHLRRLLLHGAHVTDLQPLASLSDLEELDIAMTGVTDLEPLRGLRRLRRLLLEGDYVHDLAPLHGLRELRRVGLERVPVSFEQRHALETAINKGRNEGERLIADAAGHEHFGGSCPTRPEYADAPFGR